MGDNGTLKALALASQLGFAVAGPLVVFIGGGVWADNQFGTRPWLFFLGLVLGLVSAGAALYQIAIAMPARRGAQAKSAQKPGPGGGQESQSERGTSPADKRHDN